MTKKGPITGHRIDQVFLEASGTYAGIWSNHTTMSHLFMNLCAVKRNGSVIVKYYFICFLSVEGDCHGVMVMVKGSH